MEQQPLAVQAEEIVEEQPLQEEPVAWRRGPKKKAVEETQEQIETETIVEEQPLQEEPVAWRRGPKKQPIDEKPKQEVEPEPSQAEEIIEEEPLVEEPVAWRRGPKKQPAEQEEDEKQLPKGKQKPKPKPKEEVEKIELKPIPRKKPQEAEVTEIPEEQPIETKEVALPKVSKAQIKAPKFLKKLQPKVCKPEEPTELRATIEGVPFPEVKWYLNDTELHATQNFEMNIEEKVVTLKIAKVTPELIGTYTCQVKNEAGVAISRTNIALGKCQVYSSLFIVSNGAKSISYPIFPNRCKIELMKSGGNSYLLDQKAPVRSR